MLKYGSIASEGGESKPLKGGCSDDINAGMISATGSSSNMKKRAIVALAVVLVFVAIRMGALSNTGSSNVVSDQGENIVSFKSQEKLNGLTCPTDDQKQRCNEGCGPRCKTGCEAAIPLADENTASTTTFGFGGASACGCNGDALEAAFAEYYQNTREVWTGLATPAWMAGYYHAYYEGSKTVSDLRCQCTSGKDGNCRFNIDGTFNNCATGHGGCGTCWELTSLEVSAAGTNANNCGDQSCQMPTNKKIYGIVTDNCGLEDPGGNNQWCVPYTGLLDSCPLSCPPYKSTDWNTNCPRFGGPFVEQNCNGAKLASPGKCTHSDGSECKKENNVKDCTWSNDQCVTNPGVDGNFADFKCTNAAGYKMHFDVAVQNAKSHPTSEWGRWIKENWKDNPIVTVKKIECPPNLLNAVAGPCSKDRVGQYTYCDKTTWGGGGNCENWCLGDVGTHSNYDHCQGFMVPQCGGCSYCH